MRAIDGFSVILLETLKPSIDPQSGRYIEKIRENTPRDEPSHRGSSQFFPDEQAVIVTDAGTT